ncbi:hypothetical protein J437_LFUL007360 [Ladona fulva]|uniref:Ig-like domain-containing protein n=1 Tax=Ladona fulva TaxID=123851 RepID=A0A8K0P380_LADFU|nr:hypothetical protein J437_LFUL007360 [Ladona fulva]
MGLNQNSRAMSAPAPEEDDYDYVGDSENYDEDEEEEDNYTGPPPVIHTQPIKLELKPGSNALLPCNISDLNPNIAIMWKKGSRTLFSDTIAFAAPKRYERKDDYSLFIRDVKPEDSGEYFCELSTPDAMHVRHEVYVFEAPMIRSILPGPSHIVLKGFPLTLECEVDGYPVPTVTWTKKGKHLPSGEESIKGKSITFEAVTRRHNGTYECSAENSYGKPAHASTDIIVQYAPEITIEKETVNTAEGYESELTCTVHAEPKAKVLWYLNSKHIVPSDRIKEKREGSRHILRILRTQKSDFGTYTCFANNTLGRSQLVMELSGLPSKAQFVGESPKMQNGNTHSLRWMVESNSPITEYKLLYRKKDTSDWKVSRPEVLNPEGNVYQVEAEINDLEGGSYEAMLLSKNAYGWSENSEKHTFQGIEYQKTEPQANTGTNEEPVLEESQGSGVDILRPTLLAALLSISLAYFLV